MPPASPPSLIAKMEWISLIIDLFLHLDQHLGQLMEQYGTGTYLILFLVIFFETGVVVTPFLPGDSLLFAAGALSVQTVLNPLYLFALLSLAAFLGDLSNYWIGYFFGEKIPFRENALILKKSHLEKTHNFFEKYGGKTIIIARFVPIVRTFAPFVAGLGKMTYSRFFLFNIVGGILWNAVFISAGYYFGNLPAVRRNFTLVIMAVILLSIMPAVWEYAKHYLKKTADGKDQVS